MTTGASPNNLRQLGVHQELMNILHLIISDGLMGRHKQHSLLLYTEKAMAPHSSTLAWKIPWTEEPGGLQSMGSQGVRHD